MGKDFQSHIVYEKLRDHLDGLPVGYSKTESGVEIDILKKIHQVIARSHQESFTAIPPSSPFRPMEDSRLSSPRRRCWTRRGMPVQ